MVKHVIIWKLKDELEGAEKEKVLCDIKTNLESLVGKVPGLVELKIITDTLESSNGDLMLDSTLESEEALKGYAVHPEHVAVADNFVRPYTQVRMCVDYEI